MKITIFVGRFPSPSQTFIVRKVKALAEKGEFVEVISFGRPQFKSHKKLVDNVKNIQIVYLPRDKGSNFQRVLAYSYLLCRGILKSPKDIYMFWGLARRFHPRNARSKYMRNYLGVVGLRSDIYHFEHGNLAAQYIDFIKTSAKPCVVSFRGSDINTYPYANKELKSLYKEVIEYADRIHCTSKAIARKVANYGGLKKKFVNYPSTDTSVFNPFGISKRDPYLIITVSRLNWVKGMEYALLAISQLVTDFPNIHYVIVGDGPSKDGLLFYTADLGIENNVEFYGRTSISEIKSLLGKASIFLLPSLSEGVSNAALEAMAMEVPVVTTDAGGMVEAVTDGVEGFVVPRYNPFALKEKIALLLNDGELRSRMGQRGRERVIREFTIERQVQVFIKEYEAMKNKYDLRNKNF
jgi:colanic acid/amylovoran biosynthesis glycosyltransferase